MVACLETLSPIFTTSSQLTFWLEETGAFSKSYFPLQFHPWKSKTKSHNYPTNIHIHIRIFHVVQQVSTWKVSWMLLRWELRVWKSSSLLVLPISLSLLKDSGTETATASIQTLLGFWGFLFSQILHPIKSLNRQFKSLNRVQIWFGKLIRI